MEENNNKTYGYYKFGIFYFDENNKRLFALTPNNRYTLNFANKWSYLLFAIFNIVFILKILAEMGIIH